MPAVFQTNQKAQQVRPDNETLFSVEISGEDSTMYEERIVVDDDRMSRLQKYRMLFGSASLACLCALVTCLLLKLPYEPAAALFCCCFGIFMVFGLKVRDAKG